MKNKVILGIIVFLIFLTSIGIGFYLVKLQQIDQYEMEYTSQVIGEKITDECTEEEKDLLLANAGEQKVSPNAIVVMKRHYNKCGHTTKQYVSVTRGTCEFIKK